MGYNIKIQRKSENGFSSEYITLRVLFQRNIAKRNGLVGC